MPGCDRQDMIQKVFLKKGYNHLVQTMNIYKEENK
jgi:hypothetical protein